MAREKLPPENSNESEALPDRLLREYAEEFKDPILDQLFLSVKSGYDNLKTADRERIGALLEEFLKSIRDYHDSYTGLKAAARKERMLYMDMDKFKEGVKNADARERILHSSFISIANVLSRTMKKMELDIAWRGNDSIYNRGGVNDSEDTATRDKFREWMWRIYDEKFSS